jgi:flagellar basal-body rod protein FlgC
MSDFATGFRISSSGMQAQRKRMHTVQSNLANINTTRTNEGGPYRRKDVVFEAIPEAKSFGEVMGVNDPAQEMQRVQVTDYAYDNKAPLMKYQPDHVDANEDGYVAYPNIDVTEEYVNMIQAQRSYEANVSALQASKDMAMSALEIGR